MTSESGGTKADRAKGPAFSDAAKSAAAKPIPESIRALGPLSVGHPHAGFLVNGERLPSSDDWVITVPSHGFGTRETNQSLKLCISKVRRDFPGSPKVMLGSLSAERGGYLPPHKSHRTGRDVDVYFFRKPGARWAKAATEADIDLPRTWALLRCFVTRTDVDMILIDRRVQGWLETYAKSLGEEPQWLTEMFHDRKGGKTAVVRHVPGHVAHMHVRFTSAKERRAAVRHYDELVAAGVIVPEKRALVHQVKKGDTLLALARHYGMTVVEIQRLNGMESTVIRVGQKLTIQQAVDIRGARDPIGGRPRLLPPGESVRVAEVETPAPPLRTTSAPPEVNPPEPVASPAVASTVDVAETSSPALTTQRPSEPTLAPEPVNDAAPPGPPPRREQTEPEPHRPRERSSPAALLEATRVPS